MVATPELLEAVVPGDLAVAARLRTKWPADLVALATSQAELRLKAANKFQRASQMLFTRSGLEQASGADVALHRATRLSNAGDHALDLCCGIGGDSIAMATSGVDVTVVDRDAVHVAMARHNVSVYGRTAAGLVTDVTELNLRTTDVVHIDPARRDGSDQRGGYQPDLGWCLSIPAKHVAMKVAPGIEKSLIPNGWEAEWVASGKDIKAAVLWSPALATFSAARRATVLSNGETHTMTAERLIEAPKVAAPGDWIVDPNPAVTLSGAVADLTLQLNGWLIDPRIGFIAMNSGVETAWGRTLRVLRSLPWSVNTVAKELKALNIGDLQIRRRGMAGDVEQLRRQLLKGSSGSVRATLLLTRHVDQPWALICDG